MSDDPYEEWRRLSEHYAGMFDGELLRLANEYSELTEVARQVLRDEMLKRGLGDPTKPEELQQTPGRFRFDQGIELNGDEDSASCTEDDGSPHEYTWKAELCRCATEIQAWELMQALKRSGIECWTRDPTRHFVASAVDSITFPILVAADQLEEAQKIIVQPIPQDIVEESRLEIPEYVSPNCPGCGSSDPVLVSAEPGNVWGCEVCGKEWTELDKLPDEHP